MLVMGLGDKNSCFWVLITPLGWLIGLTMQVRALQRLGSRFENLSGHERSCILSGQHRTGNCTCRVTNRDASSNDETGTRASISRIVMLAEALFEVMFSP